MKKYLMQINEYKPRNIQEECDKKMILDCIKEYGDKILLRENEIAHITSSSLIVNKNVDKILMAYHNIYQSWAWTGGHADGDEDLFYVAKKETVEETGIKNFVPLTDKIISLEVLAVNSHIRKNKYVPCHLHLNVTYALIVDESEEFHFKADENSGVMWIKVDELEKYSCEKEMIPIYNKIIEAIKEYKR